MCTADEIELDPEMGCLTYTQAEEEEWEEAEVLEEEEEELELDDEEWEEIDLEEDEEDEDW